ncbi:MAG: FMN-dependent NADH-azoreductase [Duganella sp.]
MKILHIDSSILGHASASRELSSAIVHELRRQHADATVVQRDLSEDPVAHLDGAIAAGFRPIQGGDAAAATSAEHALSEQLVKELLASDVVVIGAPMYNFSVPSQLKAWIDRVIQPGMTFRYTENGPVGLAGHQRVFIASTRGGKHSIGPTAVMDFQEAYLKAVFGFMGIHQVFFVRAENLSRGPDVRQQSLQTAKASIPAVIEQALPDPSISGVLA